MKNTLIFVLVGTLSGIVLASYIVPPTLSWYAEPGGLPGGAQVQSQVNIPSVMQYSTSRLLRGQGVGGSLGGFVGLLVGLSLAKRRRLAGKKASNT